MCSTWNSNRRQKFSNRLLLGGMKCAETEHSNINSKRRKIEQNYMCMGSGRQGKQGVWEGITNTKSLI